MDLLESYKRDIIEKVPSLPQYNKNIGLSSASDGTNVASAFGGYKNNLGRNSSKTSEIRAIFMLQTIEINGHTFNIFYDSGCGDLVVKKSAIDILLSMSRAKHEIPGPITLTGVGDQKVVCKNGVYSLKLPLCNGEEAVVNGLCVNRITASLAGCGNGFSREMPTNRRGKLSGLASQIKEICRWGNGYNVGHKVC